MPIPNPTMTNVSTSEAVCAHCETALNAVRGAHRFTQVDDLFDTNGDALCWLCVDNHYVYSDQEDCYITSLHAISLYDGGYVSRRYAEHNCYHSSDGDQWFADEYQRDEYDDARRSDGYIFDYHATNAQDEHGGWPSQTPRNSLCFGIELEMENREDDSEDGGQALSNALGGRTGVAKSFGEGRYILMRDGSLADSGVELITQPYTLDFHQKKFGWKPMLDSIAKLGKSGKGTSNCGMHVHVNRRALSALNLGKLLVFVNAPGNGELVKRVAQRDPSEWASLRPKKITDGKARNGDKYEACHLAERTVEFRIFRGNLRPDRVLKNIEFCHAAIMYTQQASMQALEAPQPFVAWLGKNKGTYPNLVKFLAESQFAKRMSAENYVKQEEI